MRRLWNDPHRCLRTSARCSVGFLAVMAAVLIAGASDAPSLVLYPLLAVDAPLALGGLVLTIRAARLFRREGDHGR